MNILILLSWQYPFPNAATKRVDNYAKGLQELGNSVKIRSIKLQSKGLIHSYINIVLQPYYCLFRLISTRERPDIIILYTFGWISKLLISFYCKCNNIKIIFEVNEKPYSIEGSLRDKYLKILNILNNWCLTRIVYLMADGFIVISENLHSFVLKYKRKKKPILKIPIIVDYEYYQIKSEGLPPGNKPYIMHSASLNDNKDGISEVFEALGIAIKEFGYPIHFYSTSKTSLESTKLKVDEILKRNNMSEFVHYLGDLDNETLLSYQQHCELVIINKVISEQNIYNFATKIGEYSALGKPIITTEIGEVANYFINNQSCFFVQHNNPKAIAEKIVYILTHPETSYNVGSEAKKLALKDFDYKINCLKLSLFFQNILCTKQ